MKFLDALEQKAKAATPGPWQNCGHARGGCKCGLVWSLPADMPIATRVHGEETPIPNEDQAKSNAAFIAAANPQTVLALLAVIEEAINLANMTDAHTRRHFDAALAKLEGLVKP